MEKTYINPTEEAGRAFMAQGIEGEVCMLNLLGFKETADYSQSPNLAPSKAISGKEAYQRYSEHVSPLLANAGSEVLFFGQSGAFLIGPESEKWDAVAIVRYQSVGKFLAFASSVEYQSIAGHRAAALADSRLLPMIEGTFV